MQPLSCKDPPFEHAITPDLSQHMFPLHGWRGETRVGVIIPFGKPCHSTRRSDVKQSLRLTVILPLEYSITVQTHLSTLRKYTFNSIIPPLLLTIVLIREKGVGQPSVERSSFMIFSTVVFLEAWHIPLALNVP